MVRNRKNLKKIGKKGSGIVDMLFIVVFFTIIVIVTVLALFMFSIINDGLSSSGLIDSEVTDQMDSFENKFTRMFDAGIIFFIFILWAGMITTSFILDNHPIFFALFAILSFVVFFIGLPLANAMDAIFTGSLAPYFAAFPMTSFIVNNWIFMLMFFVVTEGVALYAKSQTAGGQGF